TNVWNNTLDAAPPTSRVDPLPAEVNLANFVVSWSGVDDPDGAGLASYAVYVSDNGGPFMPWLERTTLTEAEYPGQVGHTYAFYSRARDNTSNMEAAPGLPDATTVVILTGDMDFDGDIDFDDIDDFVLGLRDPVAYAAAVGLPAAFHGDTDGDGDLDFDDIRGFVAILSNASLKIAGDMDLDRDVDFDDIDGFVLGLTDPDGYFTAFGVSAAFNGDTDGDSDEDFDDITGLVAILTGGLAAQAGDMDADGDVDFDDIDQLLVRFDAAHGDYDTQQARAARALGHDENEKAAAIDQIVSRLLGQRELPAEASSVDLALNTSSSTPWRSASDAWWLATSDSRPEGFQVGNVGAMLPVDWVVEDRAVITESATDAVGKPRSPTRNADQSVAPRRPLARSSEREPAEQELAAVWSEGQQWLVEDEQRDWFV
ncbi:MAG: hypothetical protein ACC645_22615, partial [Pirellulales bacterium]